MTFETAMRVPAMAPVISLAGNTTTTAVHVMIPYSTQLDHWNDNVSRGGYLMADPYSTCTHTVLTIFERQHVREARCME